MRTFLGVDQSLRKTGMVVLSETGGILLQRLVQPAGLRDAARLGFIRGALTEVIRQYQPVAAAFEGYSFKSVNRPFALGELGGVVQLAFWDADLPYHQIPPAILKRFVTGIGDADKAKMLRRTKEHWGIDFGDEDDLCDAHGLAQLLRGLAAPDKITVRHELEVVTELLTPKEKVSTKPAKSKTKISI